MRLVGVEPHSVDLERSQEFYRHVLGLEVTEDKRDHHVTFNAGDAFLCVETPGAEEYPSQDKAVVFFEVASVTALAERIGRDRFVKDRVERCSTIQTATMCCCFNRQKNRDTNSLAPCLTFTEGC